MPPPAETGLAEEQALVHQAYLLSLRASGRSTAEIHTALTAHFDYAIVADMYAYPVIGAYAIDSLYLAAVVISHLVIGTAGTSPFMSGPERRGDGITVLTPCRYRLQ